MMRAHSTRRAFSAGLLGSVFALCGAARGSANRLLGRRIRALVERRAPAGGPGAFVAVARGGRVLFQGGYGWADVECRIPFSARTVFDLASCSKAFTAAAILRLWENGRLSPADDSRRFLPELPDRHPLRPLRVADLLHMTSGLPDYTAGMGDLSAVTNTDVLHWAAKQPPRSSTGTRFSYNDTDYALLALIVERAAGCSFREYLRREIFVPLRMHHAEVLEAPGQPVPGRARGYTTKEGVIRTARYDTRVYGDGQVMTAAEDLLRWDAGLRSGAVLGTEALRYAYQSGRLDDGRETGYACGWHVGAGGHFVEHGGGWAGTSVMIRRGLEDGLTVLVLSNLDTFGAGTVAREVLPLFSGTPAARP